MSHSFGRSYLAIPGPSVIPDQVLQAMHRASPNIYEGELIDMVDTIYPDLCYAAQTAGRAAIYIGNGHAAWEASIVNTIAPGDKILALCNGSFGEGWADTAERLGVDVTRLHLPNSAGIDAAQVEAALRADHGKEFRAVILTHVDTSGSARNPIADIRAAMDAADHPALLMVDCIASLGCDRFEMDAWGVDVTVAACQKGLMTPAGMSFVFFSDKAIAARRGLTHVSPYFDCLPRIEPELFYHKFCGTAPTHHLFGLRAALDLIRAEKIENTWARHATLANAIWAAVDAWGQDGPIRFNVAKPEHRSHAVTSLSIGAPHGTELRKWVEANVGLTLGIGLGLAPFDDPAWHGNFRFGHMGHVNGQMIMGLLGGVEAGMAAIGLGFGGGGLSAAAQVIAAAGVNADAGAETAGCCTG